MNCAAIMMKDPPTVSEDETVAEAAAKLTAQLYTGLPVVDANGRFIGMFGIGDLLGLLVPRVALAGDLTANLRFIPDDPRQMRLRYDEVKARRVSEVADRNGARLAPDAPEIEAIRLCCRNQAPIPVVEKATGRLVGIISVWDAVRTLADRRLPA